jgi:heat shock protein HslJ
VSSKNPRIALGANQTTSAQTTPLGETYWKLVEVAGRPTPAQDVSREANLQFDANGQVSGSDGCNRITGSYQMKGDTVTFGQMAGTQMACINTGATDRAFREALKNTTRFVRTGDRLELFDATGTRLASLRAALTQPRRSRREA